MKLPRIINAILCEDIRMESTGKFSLAGVFGSDMATLDLQAPIICGVFAEMLPEEVGQGQFDFRVIDAAGKDLVQSNNTITVMKAERQPLILGPFNLIVSMTGEVKFQWRIGDGKWATIKAFKVLPMPDINALAIPEVLKAEFAKHLSPEHKKKL